MLSLFLSYPNLISKETPIKNHYIDLVNLSYLNGREAMLREVQEDINEARRVYSGNSEAQLKLDRRQAALDMRKARLDQEIGKVLNQN